jgi:hypothetical protein
MIELVLGCLAWWGSFCCIECDTVEEAEYNCTYWEWGGTAYDFDGNGIINTTDLLLILAYDG